MVVVKGAGRRLAERPRAKLARPGVRVVASSAAWADYDIPGSPYFVLVEAGVVTGEGSATSWAAVRNLLEQAVEESAHARAAAGRTGPGGDHAALGDRRTRRARRPQPDRRRAAGRGACTRATRACTSRPTRDEPGEQRG